MVFCNFTNQDQNGQVSALSKYQMIPFQVFQSFFQKIFVLEKNRNSRSTQRAEFRVISENWKLLLKGIF